MHGSDIFRRVGMAKIAALAAAALLAIGSGHAAENEGERMMQMEINGNAVSVVWENNPAVASLRKKVAARPVTVRMSMYGGFEQVGELGFSLPREDVQTRTVPGDIVLYSGDQIVVFYGSNSWAYTRLGRIADKSREELAGLLSRGDAELTIRSAGK
jgi:hypothetical protein